MWSRLLIMSRGWVPLQEKKTRVMLVPALSFCLNFREHSLYWSLSLFLIVGFYFAILSLKCFIDWKFKTAHNVFWSNLPHPLPSGSYPMSTTTFPSLLPSWVLLALLYMHGCRAIYWRMSIRGHIAELIWLTITSHQTANSIAWYPPQPIQYNQYCIMIILSNFDKF